MELIRYSLGIALLRNTDKYFYFMLTPHYNNLDRIHRFINNEYGFGIKLDTTPDKVTKLYGNGVVTWA